MLSTTSASELRGTSTANATENNSTSTPATGFTLHETGSTSTTGLGTNATATVTPQTMVTMLGNGSTSIPEPGSNTPVTWFTTPGTNFTAVSENGSMMTGIGSTVPSNSSISETEITPALETVSPVPGNGYTSATEAGSANTSGAMSGNGSVTGITIPATSPLPGETVSMLSTASDWSTSGEIVATDFPLREWRHHSSLLIFTTCLYCIIALSYTLCPEKGATLFLALTSPNANRFSNFFTDKQSSKFFGRAIIKYPTTL